MRSMVEGADPNAVCGSPPPPLRGSPPPEGEDLRDGRHPIWRRASWKYCHPVQTVMIAAIQTRP